MSIPRSQALLEPLAPVEALILGKGAKAVQCILTTCQRAQTLKTEGYEFIPTAQTGIYECHKPARLNRRTGELTEFEPYIVDITARTCTCIQFERCGVCKHERAIRAAVAEALALLLPPPATKTAALTKAAPITKAAPATKTQTCILCEGAGEVVRWERCSECEGKGEVQVAVGEDRWGYPVWSWQWCGGCEGRGGSETARRCGHCEGAGEVEVGA